MHNTFPQLGNEPQLGYYDSGLGTYIYHDDRGQMGDVTSDLLKALSNTGTALENTVQSDVNNLVPAAQNSVISSFLDTSTGQATVAQAQQTWLQQQQAKVVSVVTQNPVSVFMVVALIGVAIYLYTSKGKKSRVATANPKRRRKRRR